MIDTFLEVNPDLKLQGIIDDLYRRLNDCARTAAVKSAIDDDFDQGIDCRLANEISWLQDLLDKIERS